PVAIAAVDLQQMIHCTRLVATSREGKCEVQPGLVIVRIGADFGLELSDIAASTSLLCQLQRRYDARHIARLSLVRRDQSNRLLGPRYVPALQIALGQPGEGADILAVLLEDRSIDLRRMLQVPGFYGSLCRLEHRRNASLTLLAEQAV